MATYKRFEDLPVWQAAIRLAESLQNSDIEEQRHLNEASKRRWEASRSKETDEKEWREQLIEVLGPNSP